MSSESATPFFWLVGPVSHTGILWSNLYPRDIIQELHIFGFLIGIHYLFIDLQASIAIFFNTVNLISVSHRGFKHTKIKCDSFVFFLSFSIIFLTEF